MADFQEDINEIFKPEELQVMEFAHDYFGGVAKQAAIDLGGALELEPDAHLALVEAVARGIDATDRPEERRGIYNHLNALIELLGRAPSRQTLQVVPVDVEPANPVSLYKAPKVPSLDLPPPPAAGLIDKPIEDRQLRQENKTFLKKLFKGIEGIDLANISYEEAQVLADKLSETYVKLDIPRLNAEAKALRAEQLKDSFAGMRLEMIASKYGHSYAAIFKGITGVGESLSKRLKPEQLQDILVAARTAANAVGNTPVPEPNPAPAPAPAPSPNPNPNPAPAPNPEQDSHALEIPGSIEEALADVAALLGYSDKTRYTLLKQIFDESVTNSIRTPEINEIRDELRLVAVLTKNYKALPYHLNLSALEEKALLAVCGDEVAHTPPLSVNSIRGKYSKELQQEKRRIDQVLRTALAKIVAARQLMLQAGEKLV